MKSTRPPATIMGKLWAPPVVGLRGRRVDDHWPGPFSGRTVPAGYYDNVVKYVKEKADKNERLDRATRSRTTPG